MTASYRVLFQDVLTGYVHGELPVESLNYTNTRNSPGSAALVVEVEPTVSRVNAGSLVPGAATAVYVERDGRFVWSGLYWDAEVDYAAGTMTLQCEGWLSYYRLRHVHTTLQFTQVDQAAIARSLVQHAATYGPGSNLGMIRFGTEMTGVLRDRTYQEYDHKSIGEAVEQLADVIDGFGFAFEAEWTGPAEDELGVWFRIRYPATGRRREVVLEDGVNCDINTAKLGGKSVRNFALFTGAGDGPEQLWATSARPSTVHPRLEAVVSASDVKEYQTLKAKADNVTRAQSAPVLLPAIEVYPDASLGLSALAVGDVVDVVGGRGLVDVAGEWLVTEIGVAVDASGAESVAATVAPVEVFEVA
ncbi:hypothetical protein [Actinosynnema sp. NPDC020468]|uniref:hypothetical protein n=1 Tax=Actinosynnema sp. NPDC020468 TaxID=3154488 RepID=UPI0033BFD3F2